MPSDSARSGHGLQTAGSAPAEHEAADAVGNGANQVVGGAIPLWKIKGVEDIATQLFQRPNERLRQLGIQQDPHAEMGSIR
jgi:hypothetical protein